MQPRDCPERTERAQAAGKRWERADPQRGRKKTSDGLSTTEVLLAAIRTSTNEINPRNAQQNPLLPTRFAGEFNPTRKQQFHFPQPPRPSSHETDLISPNPSHQLTTKIRTNKNYPVSPGGPSVERFSFSRKKRKSGPKAAPQATRYEVLGAIYPPPQPQPASSRQSPSPQSAPAHFPRWPRYRCNHPHKDAGFHPHASPAH